MKIGELATKTSTQVPTIRYYEQQGLLPDAPRSEGNYRVYGPEHIERLVFIRRCRSLDMTLGEIQTLLGFKDAPRESCDEVNTLLDEHIGHVSTRIRELGILEQELKQLRQQCHEIQDTAHCGILNALSQSIPPQQKIRDTSCVHGAHGTRVTQKS